MSGIICLPLSCQIPSRVSVGYLLLAITTVVAKMHDIRCPPSLLNGPTCAGSLAISGVSNGYKSPLIACVLGASTPLDRIVTAASSATLSSHSLRNYPSLAPVNYYIVISLMFLLKNLSARQNELRLSSKPSNHHIILSVTNFRPVVGAVIP